MTSEQKSLMIDIITDELEAIGKMVPGSKEKEAAVKTLAELISILDSEYETEFSSYEKDQAIEIEKKKTRNEFIKVLVDNGTRLAGGGLALLGTRMAVKSDLGGEIISKIGLSVAPKVKI